MYVESYQAIKIPPSLPQATLYQPSLDAKRFRLIGCVMVGVVWVGLLCRKIEHAQSDEEHAVQKLYHTDTPTDTWHVHTSSALRSYICVLSCHVIGNHHQSIYLLSLYDNHTCDLYIQFGNVLFTEK